jgi:hypothetical protein
LTHRSRYAVLVVITVIIGLAVHFQGIGLGALLRDVSGDALWAAMIYWLASLAAPNAGTAARGAVALFICFAVELSQQIEHPVLQAVRSSPFGHIIVGSDFDARDLIAYTAGIAAALLVDAAVIRSSLSSESQTATHNQL